MVGCGVVQKGQLKSHLFPSNILAEAISMTHSDMLYWLDISTFYLYEPLLFQIFDPWKFIKAGLCLSSIPFYSQQPRSIKSVSHFLSLHVFLSMQNIGRSIRSRQLFFWCKFSVKLPWLQRRGNKLNTTLFDRYCLQNCKAITFRKITKSYKVQIT